MYSESAPGKVSKPVYTHSVLIIGRVVPKNYLRIFDAITESFSVNRYPAMSNGAIDDSAEPRVRLAEMARLMVQFANPDDVWSDPRVVEARQSNNIVLRIGDASGGDINLVAPSEGEVLGVLHTLANLMDACAGNVEGSDSIFINGWTIQCRTNLAVRGAKIVSLGRMDIRLLRALISAGSGGISRDDLIARVWGGAPRVRNNSLNAAIHRLRQRGILSPTSLISIRRGGYVLKR